MTQAMQHDRPNVAVDPLAEVDQLLAGFVDADNASKAASIETLYQHYKPLAVRYARRENAADLEGVVDLALFDTFRALTNMRNVNDHTFRRYMFRAIQNYAIKEARKPAPMPIEVDEGNAAEFVGFEADLIGSLYVCDLIEDLPEDQRAVMTHRIIHGRTADETGLILGKKPNAVHQLQHRATRRLQRILLAAAVLLMLIGAAVVIVRQADSQTIDSSPARPTTIEQTQRSTTTTTQPLANNQTPTELAIGGQAEPDQQIQAGTIAQQQQQQQQPDTPTPTTPTENAVPSDGAESTTPNPNPDTPPTTTPEAPTTTTPEAPTTTTPEAPATTPIETTVSNQAVLAVDDALELTVGQAVDYDVTANDGPRNALGTVTWISGSVDGLTLDEAGRLTGIPTVARSVVIVYRLTGNNGTFDIGQIRIVVE